MAAYCPLIDTFESINNSLLHGVSVTISESALKLVEQLTGTYPTQSTISVSLDWESVSTSDAKRLFIGTPDSGTEIPVDSPLYQECKLAIEVHMSKVNPLKGASGPGI